MKVLMIGDVVGRGGRKTLSTLLPKLVEEQNIDFVIAQGENSAGGFGLTKKTSKEIFDCGVDVITSGNHIWDKPDIFDELESLNSKILRPNNYPKNKPGTGIFFNNELVVINLMGSVWMGDIDSPFSSISTILDDLPNVPIFIDFHAEATSEKAAMAWHLDGKITALVGTHTHVPTADNKILPQGTGFVSDLGMVGGKNSILGMDKDASINRFFNGQKRRMNPVEKGEMVFNSVLIDVDQSNKRTKSITRLDKEINI
ncbi:MAG: metallophosphoesterase [Chloroflexi bacterium]|nr:metallophosphoesterase [Chloroflexota bacterium]